MPFSQGKLLYNVFYLFDNFPYKRLVQLFSISNCFNFLSFINKNNITYLVKKNSFFPSFSHSKHEQISPLSHTFMKVITLNLMNCSIFKGLRSVENVIPGQSHLSLLRGHSYAS